MSGSGPAESLDMAARRALRGFTSTVTDGCTARLGRLALPGRHAIETPSYSAVTSRGAIPHLTPDNLSQHTSCSATYMALEDFIEKKDPPIYGAPRGNHRRLHSFTATPSSVTTVLAPRRLPAVTTPMGNDPKTICIFTSTGFYSLTVPQFASAVERLQPDVVVPLADLPHTSRNPVPKRQLRMAERTEEWLDEFFRCLSPEESRESLGVSIFAPVLPVEHPIQWGYLRHLSEDVIDSLAGLAIYDVNLLPELMGYGPIAGLPKLSLDPPKSPHDVLRQVSLGVDICAIPFVNVTSDAGVAFKFTFPPPDVDSPQPLGMNMWLPEHSTTLSPLSEGCKCYTCSKHHGAYVQHLLNAKEMLGWTLLQIHNLHAIDELFGGIRRSLARGAPDFEASRKKFLAAYEPELPEGTGDRPRARGYHFKSDAGQDRINKPSWVDLDGQKAPFPASDSSRTMQPSGSGAETPVTPDADGQALAAKGFGQAQE